MAATARQIKEIESCLIMKGSLCSTDYRTTCNDGLPRTDRSKARLPGDAEHRYNRSADLEPANKGEQMLKRALTPIIAVLVASASGCGKDKPEAGGGPEPFVVPDAKIEPVTQAIPERFPAITNPAPEGYTEDGIPIMTVRSGSQQRQGDVTWISQAWNALEIPLHEATDGARIYFGRSGISSGFADVLVRDGTIYTDVLAAVSAVTPHPGGCAAAAQGRILLSSPGHPPLEHGNQLAWTIEPTGEVRPIALPDHTSSSDSCKAWLDPDGAFVLGTFGLVEFHGKEVTKDQSWYAGRTEMATARGPKFCFESCNRQEISEDGGAAQQALDQALGGCHARYHAFRSWVVAECRREHKVARIARGGQVEVLTGLPDNRNQYGDIIAMTARGDVIIGLDYGMRSYVVWPVGSPRHSPVRTLAPNEALATSSPTLLLRGLPSGIPEDTVGATLMGATIAFGAGGSTHMSQAITRGQEARVAAVARAVAVLPRSQELVVAHEAVVDLECGAYVRSPIGWEGQRIHDWSPPQLPALFRAAVYDPPTCLPLAEVVAVPGNPDLLLARTRDGRLVAAWLPPALPLPAGTSHFHPRPPEPPPVQRPQPGTGWFDLGRADSIAGLPGLPAPGGDKDVERSSWHYGGAAVVRAGSAAILVTPHGPVTIDPRAVPMAILQYEIGAYGALGSKLLFCDTRCRILDPGVPGQLIAVVPRAKHALVLGYDGGRNGIYNVPPTGGQAVAEHPLATAIRAVMARRPRDTASR
jgi:hypothetical protein